MTLSQMIADLTTRFTNAAKALAGMPVIDVDAEKAAAVAARETEIAAQLAPLADQAAAIEDYIRTHSA